MVMTHLEYYVAVYCVKSSKYWKWLFYGGVWTSCRIQCQICEVAWLALIIFNLKWMYIHARGSWRSKRYQNFINSCHCSICSNGKFKELMLHHRCWNVTYKKAGFMVIAFIYLYFEWINFTDELGFFIPEDPPAPPEIGLDATERAIVENYIRNAGLGNCQLVSWIL